MGIGLARYADGIWRDSDCVIGKRARMMDRFSGLFGMTGRVVDAFEDATGEYLVIDWSGWRTTEHRGRVRIER